MNIKGGGKIGGKYMTKEEIIETLKEIKKPKNLNNYADNTTVLMITAKQYKAIRDSIELIDKQQKEIEELKRLLENRDNEISNNLEIQEICCKAETKLERDLYWKDKIIDKIQELLEQTQEIFKESKQRYAIKVLQELLEEE